jgi:hypothetical protein
VTDSPILTDTMAADLARTSGHGTPTQPRHRAHPTDGNHEDRR